MSFEIERFLLDYNIPSRKEGPNSHSGWIQINCPFCRDNNFHGGFNISKGYFNCWKCGGHRLESLIQKLLKSSFNESKILVKEYKGATRFNHAIQEKENNKKQAFTLPKYFSVLNRQYEVYLEKRNFDPKYLIKKYDLKASGPVGEYKFRIIAPIYYNGQIVSFQGRDITNIQKVRYKACHKEDELVHHKHILYNLDNANNDSVIVVEGFFDVFRIGNDCVATFGTGWTTEQFSILRNKYKNIFIIYDNEKDAQNKAIKLSISLSAFNKYTEVIKLDNGDPAELNSRDVYNLRKELNL